MTTSGVTQVQASSKRAISAARSFARQALSRVNRFSSRLYAGLRTTGNAQGSLNSSSAVATQNVLGCATPTSLARRWVRRLSYAQAIDSQAGTVMRNTADNAARRR